VDAQQLHKGGCVRTYGNGRVIAQTERRRTLTRDEQLMPERIIEVAYDHMQGNRFRQAVR
jgi:hypothetical protein